MHSAPIPGPSGKKLLFCFVLLAGITAAGSSRADIYRFDGEGDTISFSDSPNDKRFQLIIKEQQSAKAKKESASHRKALRDLRTDEAQLAPAAPAGDRHLPVQGRITSSIGLRNDPFDGRLKHHNGLDIAAPSGTPVKPVAPGTVIFSGWRGGYGNTVIVDHHDGMFTVYAHHATNQVAEGTDVTRDTILALSGSTGRSTGPHLHFEAWRNGTNITKEFIPGHVADRENVAAAAPPIRRYLQPDGSIIFTNLR
jgi:murein DD-endopeptidase MepM/ murein hydrolase activator NlpD